MFAYLNGTLTHKSPTEVHLECGGVGYLLHISLQTYADIEQKAEAKVFTYLHVREDAMILFGFSTQDERQMFLHLISVSGIGPNTARLILSSMTTKELVRAIIHEEVVLIQTIKGIGPKSAKRLVLELKDKVKSMEADLTAGVADVSDSAVVDEAVAALTMLGFKKAKAEQTVRKVWKDQSVGSVEELLKLSLKIL